MPVGQTEGGKSNQHIDHVTFEEELKGALSNLICATAWLAPIALLPLSVFLITKGHGVLAVLGGFIGMCILLGGPKSLGFRAIIYAIFLIAAWTSPATSNHAFLGSLLLLVLLATITDVPGRPKRWSPNPSFCRLITKTLDGRKYYRQAELRGAIDKIKPGKNMFAVHPHGLLTAGWTWNLFWNLDLHERTGRIGFLCDEGMRVKSPTFRLFCDWYEGKDRYAAAATKSEIKKAMERGDSLALLPGGFQEATICQMGKERVYVKKRQGFIKYCLQGGYSVTPVYNFGESETYMTFTGMLKWRLRLAEQNVPAAAMFGNPLCPVLPRRKVSLLSYVGEPLQLPQIVEPSKTDVEKWHGKYMDALKELFDKHKAEAGYPNATLELW